ncbi:MAG: SHOCT domain-containing protein [Candidatus Andersenbacteria bacterium]|nr:SHOCT domain-containing protein [Candidatus Andersenbacteria bacterium]MBI3251209.1 SHOCT domain-containing protein [Candidatus Andersenbacteria bacterium]
MRIFTVYLVSLLALVGPLPIYAQAQQAADHTTREEAEGKEVWQQLQDKQLTCDTLSDEQFAALGEYFMGQMMGDSHAAMNQMMINMMGEEGEEQMHVVMGKRLSGCDPAAAYPNSGTGFMPMMNMMMGGGFNMMNWNGWGSGMPFFGGGIFMILWWVLIIGGIVFLGRWMMMGQGMMHHKGTSALDILKERYAKGEISKQEFDDKKKDIS